MQPGPGGIADVERRYPARRYVLVDDKPRILSAVKRVWGERVTTVFPRQGKFALDATVIAPNPAPDLSVERIGELLRYDLRTLATGLRSKLDMRYTP